MADAGKPSGPFQPGAEPADAGEHIKEPDILCAHWHSSFLNVVIKACLVICRLQWHAAFLTQRFPVTSLQNEMLQLIAGDHREQPCLFVKSLLEMPDKFFFPGGARYDPDCEREHL